MTDNPPDPTDTFDKETVKKFGPRGSPVFERETKQTDLEDLTERVEHQQVAFCTCGAPLTATGQVYRCCGCELISCDRCIIRLHRQHLCPTCARTEYALDKRVFVSLLFLKNNILAPSDLAQVETIGDEPVEITVDRTASVLVEHDYLDDGGDLTPAGQEAYHVGKQLYEEDDDVQSMVQNIRVQEVVNNGGT